ncbi:cadherin repeat domain-containing protein [Thiothrix subterranea]|uniref:cadherin repeat domain-containing protein n=1 Tax=Thiothrix subterranea TaxID=2735563 RepID=UPI00280B9BFD|nr:cadherin domain-containing protein [Thiothrix subterranea]
MFTIVITDANDAPIIISDGGEDIARLSVAENTTAVTTVTSADQDGDTLNYTISGGDDAGLFTLDPVTGELTFTLAPDFENPLDTNGDNVYDIIVTVSDGRGGIDTQQLAISVTDTNESPRITSNGGSPSGALIIEENNTEVTTVIATDPDTGDVLTYSISGGADAELFTLDPVSGALVFKITPDFENPEDTDTDNRYEVELTATDRHGNTDTQTLIINITDSNDAPLITSDGGEAVANLSVDENTTAVTTVTSTDQDGNTLSYNISGGADATLFSIDPNTGVLTFIASPTLKTPAMLIRTMCTRLL